MIPAFRRLSIRRDRSVSLGYGLELKQPPSMSELLPPSSMSSTTLQTENGFELLCALSSVELSPERRERIVNSNLSVVDWSEVIGLAEHHGVLPLAARNLIELLCLES